MDLRGMGVFAVLCSMGTTGCVGPGDVETARPGGPCPATVAARVDNAAPVERPALVGSARNLLGTISFASEERHEFDRFNFEIEVAVPGAQPVGGCLTRVVVALAGHEAVADCLAVTGLPQLRCGAAFDARFQAGGAVASVYVDVAGPGLCPLGSHLSLLVRPEDASEVVGQAHLDAACEQVTNWPEPSMQIVPFLVTVEPGDPVPGTRMVAPLDGGARLGWVKLVNGGGVPFTARQASFAIDGELREPARHLAGAYELLVSGDAGAFTVAARSVDALGDEVQFQQALAEPFTVAGGASRQLEVRADLERGVVASGDRVHVSLDQRTWWQLKVAESELGYDGDLDGRLDSQVTITAVAGLPIALGTIEQP